MPVHGLKQNVRKPGLCATLRHEKLCVIVSLVLQEVGKAARTAMALLNKSQK